jgi:tRNA (Thr-GGU) A37 N-methylase
MDLEVTVRGLDAVNGTPVLDLKPVVREFLRVRTSRA